MQDGGDVGKCKVLLFSLRDDNVFWKPCSYSTEYVMTVFVLSSYTSNIVASFTRTILSSYYALYVYYIYICMYGCICIDLILIQDTYHVILYLPTFLVHLLLTSWFPSYYIFVLCATFCTCLKFTTTNHFLFLFRTVFVLL